MSNQIFFAKSTNQGAPQVTNSWGALVSLLKTILTDGYVVTPVQSVVQEGTDVKVTCTSTHSLEQFQTISLVSNATSETYLTARIVKIDDSTSFTIKVEASQNVPTSNMLVKIPSAGWEVLYSLDNKAVFKPTSANGPNHFLFVDNSIPSGYTTSHVKFATFGLAERYAYGFTPEGLTNPVNWDDLNPKGTGTSMTLGHSKIFYGISTSYDVNSSYAPTYGSTNGNCDWFLIGDESYYYLISGLRTNSTNSIITGAGQYDCIHAGYNFNTFMNTMSYDAQAANGAASLHLDYSSLAANTRQLRTLSGYNNLSGNVLSTSSYSGVLNSGATNVLSNAGPTNLFKVYVRDSNNILMGTLKNIYWLAVAQPYTNRQIFKQGDSIYIAISTYLNSANCQVVFKIGED